MLADVRAGRVPQADVCDAQAELLRVARHHGDSSVSVCPLCDGADLREVSFAFGRRLGRRHGGVVAAAEISAHVALDGVTCYTVEVCLDCRWNHLLRAHMGIEPPDLEDPETSDRESAEPGERE